jgi:hypothetical protein
MRAVPLLQQSAQALCSAFFLLGSFLTAGLLREQELLILCHIHTLKSKLAGRSWPQVRSCGCRTSFSALGLTRAREALALMVSEKHMYLKE